MSEYLKYFSYITQLEIKTRTPTGTQRVIQSERLLLLRRGCYASSTDTSVPFPATCVGRVMYSFVFPHDARP